MKEYTRFAYKKYTNKILIKLFANGYYFNWATGRIQKSFAVGGDGVREGYFIILIDAGVEVSAYSFDGMCAYSFELGNLAECENDLDIKIHKNIKKDLKLLEAIGLIELPEHIYIK